MFPDARVRKCKMKGRSNAPDTLHRRCQCSRVRPINEPGDIISNIEPIRESKALGANDAQTMKMIKDERRLFDKDAAIVQLDVELIDIPWGDAHPLVLENMNSGESFRPVVQIHLVTAPAGFNVEMT